MTINRIIYIILILVLIVFFVLYIDKLSLIVLIFAILLPILSLIMCIIARKNVSFDFKVKSKTVPKDVPIKIDVTVTNHSYLPISNMVMLFEYSNTLDGKIHKMTITIPLTPNGANRVSFNIVSKYCGIVNIRLFESKIYDNLKLFCLKKRHQQECSMLIMPKLHDIPLVLQNSSNEMLESDTFSKTKSGDDCSEVFNIREYQEGDRLNRIHWKLSSKSNETYVKEYSLPISNSIVIIPEIVNHGADSISTMDTITELLLSISQALNYHEVHHKISIYHENNSYIESISNSEETYTTIGKIVRNGMPNDTQPYAFKYFQAVNECNNYSHTIYITNMLDINVLSNLENFNSVKKTVFVVSNIPLDDSLLTYNGIQVVQVVQNKIRECVSEFVV